MTKPRIAVLGLGIMGNGIASNFLRNGYEVTVWNRTVDKCHVLGDEGAKVATSPAEATECSDIIFDVTASDESSRYVFFDEADGILSVANSNQTLIACATLSIGYTLELAMACESKGLTFFDMPMTGSRVGAESGNLNLLIGGDRKKLDAIEEHLEAISSDRPYFGEAGSGMKFKLILNAIQAAHVVAFGDSMRQASSAGVDLDAAGNYLISKPGGFPTQMAWNLFRNPPEKTNFSVMWILKDLKYTKEMLDEVGYSSPSQKSILEISIEVFQKAFDAGHGDADWTIVNNL